MTQPPQLTARFSQALDVARTLHASDVRKGTAIPYLSHVMAVASIVLEHGGDEDQAIAALLHDAGEDHGGELRLRAIEAEFGAPVASIVRSCSDDLPDQGASKRDWWTRKLEYLEHLSCADRRVALVSAADKLHNARSILTDHRTHGGALWVRFNKDAGREGSLWYYRSLASTFDMLLASAAPALARELCATVEGIVDSVCDREEVAKDALFEQVAATAAERLRREGRGDR